MGQPTLEFYEVHTIKMERDGAICNAERRQVPLMKKDGWRVLGNNPGRLPKETPTPLEAMGGTKDPTKMRKAELLAHVKGLNYDVDGSWTVAQLLSLLEDENEEEGSETA